MIIKLNELKIKSINKTDKDLISKLEKNISFSNFNYALMYINDDIFGLLTLDKSSFNIKIGIINQKYQNKDYETSFIRMICAYLFKNKNASNISITLNNNKQYKYTKDSFFLLDKYC